MIRASAVLNGSGCVSTSVLERRGRGRRGRGRETPARGAVDSAL
jgi:hypothetical protein